MEANNWTYDEAIEWVEYNVERALPYYGKRAPVIKDVLRISPKNKRYDSLKIILTK